MNKIIPQEKVKPEDCRHWDYCSAPICPLEDKVKNLITKECANHEKIFNDIKNYCSNRDRSVYRDKDYPKSIQCIYFFENNARCEYFEKAVLGMNPQLEALYRAKYQARQIGFQLTEQDKNQIIKEKSPIAGKVNIHCKKCKKIFLADNYRSQYCEKCRKDINRKNWRDNKRKKYRIPKSAR